MNSKTTSKKIHKERKTRKLASAEIYNFMKNTENKRKSIFLKTICPDSGVCIAFGKDIVKINSFFSNFTDFKYVTSSRSIGEKSVNGFVKELKYSREGYDSYAVLKSSLTVDPEHPGNYPDNLMYEYEIGKFINKMNIIFPCFLETYGMFKYDSELWEKASNNNIKMSLNDLKSDLTQLHDIDYSVGCENPKLIAILIQHIKNAITMNSFMQSGFDIKSKKKMIHFLKYEIIGIIYQIYMPLFCLKNEFTHYDLHENNVLLYKPFSDSVITYNYHFISGETVLFKSRYIAKIIDYGRGFYNDMEANHDSEKTYQIICNTTSCDPNCGSEKGLGYLEPVPKKPSVFYHFISSQTNNVSADLRLGNFISSRLGNSIDKIENIGIDSNDWEEIYDLFSSITNKKKENINSGLPEEINNIIDMHSKLKEYIMKNQTEFMEIYDKMNNIGNFHIYEDRRPMKFVSVDK